MLKNNLDEQEFCVRSQKRMDLQVMSVTKVLYFIYRYLNGCTVLFFLCSEHHPVTQGK